MNDKKKNYKRSSIIWIPAGMAAGIVLGFLFGETLVGMAIGLVFGNLISVIDRKKE